MVLDIPGGEKRAGRVGRGINDSILSRDQTIKTCYSMPVDEQIP